MHLKHLFYYRNCLCIIIFFNMFATTRHVKHLSILASLVLHTMPHIFIYAHTQYAKLNRQSKHYMI